MANGLTDQFSWPNSFEIPSFQEEIGPIPVKLCDAQPEDVTPVVSSTSETTTAQIAEEVAIAPNRSFVNATSNPLIAGPNIVVSKIFIVTNNVQLAAGPNPFQINGLEFIIFNNNPRDTICVTSTINQKILAKIKPDRAAQFVYIAVINKFAKI
jgi:hypothetical protein